MKVFISQPMRGKTDEQIEAERAAAIKKVKAAYPNETIEIVDTFFKDFNGNRLEFLGKSIMEGLAKADLAVFVGDIEEYDGCVCERFIAGMYNVPMIFIKE